MIGTSLGEAKAGVSAQGAEPVGSLRRLYKTAGAGGILIAVVVGVTAAGIDYRLRHGTSIELRVRTQIEPLFFVSGLSLVIGLYYIVKSWKLRDPP